MPVIMADMPCCAERGCSRPASMLAIKENSQDLRVSYSPRCTKCGTAGTATPKLPSFIRSADTFDKAGNPTMSWPATSTHLHSLNATFFCDSCNTEFARYKTILARQ